MEGLLSYFIQRGHSGLGLFLHAVVTYYLCLVVRVDPGVVAFVVDQHFHAGFVAFEDLVDEEVDVRFCYSLSADGAVPISILFLCLYESEKTDAGEMFAVSASDGYFDSFASVGT